MTHLTRTLGAIGLVVSLGACEHVDSVESVPAPNPGPGVSAQFDLPPSAEIVARVEPPPPPTRAELVMARRMSWFAMLSMEAQAGVNRVCRWRLENPCGTMLTGRPSPEPGMMAALPQAQHGVAYDYCDNVRGRNVCDTPLVVAFDSEPIAFADHWPSSTTPWLALDRDGDGAITGLAELFGDASVLADGTTAKNGFLALAAYDDNHDGVIDRNDAVFGKLLLWADRDANRTSIASELRPASEVIVSIPLANQLVVRCTASDDCEGERGLVYWRAADGTQKTGAVVDVYIH